MVYHEESFDVSQDTLRDEWWCAFVKIRTDFSRNWRGG